MKRGRKTETDLVDVLVDAAVVEGAVRPVEDKVFNEQRARQLHGKGRQRRQRPNQLFVVDVVEQKVRQGVCVACGARRG